MFNKLLNTPISRLLNLFLGVGATLTMATPALAQSSIMIYQRSTTYDNYSYPRVRHYIYSNPISTPHRANPIKGQIIYRGGSLYPKRGVYVRPHVRQHVKDSTLFNPVLVNPHIRNSTIINPTIINRTYHRQQPRRSSVFIYSLP